MVEFAAALRLIDEWIAPAGPSGVGAAVWFRGDLVAERYAGERRPGEPVDAATLFALASVTKPISAATVMALVERGLFSLDESVARLVPEFRVTTGGQTDLGAPELERLRPGITVRQLLSHTSGLPEDLVAREQRQLGLKPLADILSEMSRAPLQSAPGERLRYSNTGYGVLTRLVELTTGRPFWEVTRELILDPLGLADILAAPVGATSARTAQVADPTLPGTPSESYNSEYWRDLAMPWGGLFGTPRAAVEFAGAFMPDGPRVLAQATVEAMITDQTLGVPGGVESGKVEWEAGRWGLGWEIKGDKRRHWTGELTSPRTFCHFGHAGTLLWGDPARNVALSVFSNRTVTRMWTYILPRWARLSNAVVAAATANG